MQITVQFFSQLRELAGASEEAVQLPDGATAGDLLRVLYQRHPPLAKWDRNILIGAGVEFVERDHPLQPEESIAIMPPVQGG
jgi:molybdopterin converting factor small subunit